MSGVKLALARMDNALVRYHKAGSGGGGEGEGDGEDGAKGGQRGSAKGGGEIGAEGGGEGGGEGVAHVVALAPGEVMKMSGTIGNLSLADASTPGTHYPEIIGLQRQPNTLGGGGGGGDEGGTLLLEGEVPLSEGDHQSVVEFSYTSFDHQSLKELEYGSALECRFR